MVSFGWYEGEVLWRLSRLDSFKASRVVSGVFFFSSRRRHTRCSRDWSSDVCSSDLILSRTLPPFMSTFPNEIVTCQLPDGRKRRVFIKYQAGQSHACYGHRGDVPYETEVYRRVLHSLPN